MPAPEVILNLVARFRDNEEAYRRDYGETETRREFLDPFFKALGWDIDNTAGNAEAYKDVVHEDSVKVGQDCGGREVDPDHRPEQLDDPARGGAAVGRDHAGSMTSAAATAVS